MLLFTKIEALQDGAIAISLAYPTGCSNRISFVAWKPSMPEHWSLLSTKTLTPATNIISYVDVEGRTNRVGFYAAYNADTDWDGDGLSDGDERYLLGTDPDQADTDGDGMADGVEIWCGLNPVSPADAHGDLDNDGLPNSWEVRHGLDPTGDGTNAMRNGPLGDPDGDGFINICEYINGSRPDDPLSVPAGDRFVSHQGAHVFPFDTWEKAATNIQAALDAVRGKHEVVYIADGVYEGQGNSELDLGGKRVTVAGQHASGVILDGQGQRRLVHCRSGESRETVLARLQFRNGAAPQGGSIEVESSSVSVLGCLFTASAAKSGPGGGIDCSNGYLRIENCQFVTCVAYGNGAALSVRNGAAYVANCKIEKCFATYGTISSEASSVVLMNSTLTDNVGYQHGAAVYCRSGDLRLIECTLAKNVGHAYGGGIYCHEGADVRVLNCTLTENLAFGYGGGLYGKDSKVSLTNTIVWNNSSHQGPPFDQIVLSGTSLLRLDHCIVQGKAPSAGDAVLARDPHLIPGSYRLPAGSAAIDAGAPPPKQVQEGKKQVAVPPFVRREESGIRDIGVHEFVDTDGDNMSDDWERQYFGNLDQTSTGDADGDGLINAVEYLCGSNPTNKDSDSDGIDDRKEVQVYHTSPINPDTDGDAMPDEWEVRNGLDPGSVNTVKDTDGDGVIDAIEYMSGTDPTR